MIYVEKIMEYLCQKGIQACYHGKQELQINGISSISNLKPGTVSWMRRYKECYMSGLGNCEDALIITTEEAWEHLKNFNFLVVEKPKMCFFEIVKKFFQEEAPGNISKSAVVKTDKVGKMLPLEIIVLLGKML